MTEEDIKHETKHFFVAWNSSKQHFEVLKKCSTHSYVVGHSTDLTACIRTANRLEPYHSKA